ncbi:MAG: GyrI-like domain-containing protein [Saprospiraceae bacterium]|nr:GyrI-like domain-containing protein [Saprospiraceae bacterium]
MKPLIIRLDPKKFVGKSKIMSLTQNMTAVLWKEFMPLRKEIKNALGTELYALQQYPALYFEHFDPSMSFRKWALMEVSDLLEVPEGLESMTIEGGLYAVFAYKGMPGEAAIFEYIYNKWLPASEYALDDRPHFEVLGEKYKNGDPESEEEIWIPIREK